MRRRTDRLSIEDFMLRPVEPIAPVAGQALIATRMIALDPYLARAMKSWTGEHPDWGDGTIHGRVIGEVLATRSPALAVGDHVLAVARWQAFDVVDAAQVEILDSRIDPPSLALGVVGRSGITAWVGLHLAAPQSGETLLVSAASGPVGSVVGQLAKARGLRVVGTAGGEEKCAYVRDTLGFDACLDHRLPDLVERIAAAAPHGVDILFENVGAPSLDAALPAMNRHGRIQLCGLAAHYNDEQPMALRHFKELLYRAITLRGFITAEHSHLFAPALAALHAGIDEGWIRHSETIVDGLENAPAAYLDMLKGQGIGKRLIRP
jgi:NADPH-dependent curcumin reductase CurA